MQHITDSIRALGFHLSVKIAPFSLCILTVVLLPMLGYASVTFIWVPTDGSASSGVLTIDAPTFGGFSVPETAVTSYSFSFGPGLSVDLNNAKPSIVLEEGQIVRMVSFDGISLDTGLLDLSLLEDPSIFIYNTFIITGSDVSKYDPGGQNLIVRGRWVRAGMNPILDVINIRPITNRHDIGNAYGLAYNPTSNVIYLSQGDSRGGFIYTLDTEGKLLNEFNFETVYRPDSYPTSLSYDTKSGHLFVFALFEPNFGTGNVVEMSPDGSTIFGEVTIRGVNPPAIDYGLTVRDDGIWQTLFANDAIRHYTRGGEFIEDVSVAGSFPLEFSALQTLTSSFQGGFFLVDHSGRRIVEVDRTGNEIVAVTTAMLGNGRGLAIDSDSNTQRIFLQINNEQIYVLSAAFLRLQNVNSLVRLRAVPLITQFDTTPGLDAPAGTFQITATFDNDSNVDICNPFFQVVELSRGNRLQGVWIEPAGEQIQGPGEAMIGHPPFVLGVGSNVQFRFLIDLETTAFFNFFVNMWGTPQTPGHTCP